MSAIGLGVGVRVGRAVGVGVGVFVGVGVAVRVGVGADPEPVGISRVPLCSGASDGDASEVLPPVAVFVSVAP